MRESRRCGSVHTWLFVLQILNNNRLLQELNLHLSSFKFVARINFHHMNVCWFTLLYLLGSVWSDRGETRSGSQCDLHQTHSHLTLLLLFLLIQRSTCHACCWTDVPSWNLPGLQVPPCSCDQHQSLFIGCLVCRLYLFHRFLFLLKEQTEVSLDDQMFFLEYIQLMLLTSCLFPLQRQRCVCCETLRYL